MQDTAPIVQAIFSFGETLSTLFVDAASALWLRDEFLFVAVFALLFQTCWILSLRFRLRRTRSKLSKLLDETGKAGQENGRTTNNRNTSGELSSESAIG